MTEHKLQRYHDKYTATGMRFMGYDLHDLSREDLIVVAVMGWEAMRREREEMKSRIDFLASLKRR